MKKKLLFPLTGLLLASVALAQVVGIPAEYDAAATAVIGLLASVLTYALTAVAKKLGKTSGVTTVKLSVFLSLLTAFGFTFAAKSVADLGFWQTLLVALIAFAQSNGAYIAQQYASGKASNSTLPLEAQPLLGGLIGGSNIDAFLFDILKQYGVPASTENIFKFGVKLARVAPDLLDGDRYLKAENRLIVQRAVLELKKELVK